MAAIYMWFVNGVQYQVLTTTLYPIEITEGLQLSIGLSAGAMRIIPNESFDISYQLTQAPLLQILLTTGPYDEAFDISYKLLQAPLLQILLTTGPYDEAFDISYKLLQAPLISKLVTGDTPDEKLLLSIGLRTSECSMSHI